MPFPLHTNMLTTERLAGDSCFGAQSYLNLNELTSLEPGRGQEMTSGLLCESAAGPRGLASGGGQLQLQWPGSV